MNISRAAPLLGLVFWLAACSFAPPYHEPESVRVPENYREIDWKTAAPRDRQPGTRWWTVFGDSTLDALEDKVTDANQNLKAAFSRLQEARADTRVARADLFPVLTAGASAERSRVSTNSPTYLSSSNHTLTEGNDFTLEADLSYEIDLGKSAK